MNYCEPCASRIPFSKVSYSACASPRHIFKSLIALSLLSSSFTVVAGQIKDDSVTSGVLGAKRPIHVFLPASYEKEPGRRYPVLYLHDGQNVFSSAGPNAAFGWGSWELDKTVDEFSKAGKMQEIIMVSVDNSPARMREYSGRSYSTNETSLGRAPGDTAFEKYAAFLITELKPKIDREYRTMPEPAHTGVMGSSLGGICSLVLAWEHPEIYGCAASLSGSFQIEQGDFLKTVLSLYQGKPKPIRIYLDSGTVTPRGGDDGRALTAQVAVQLRRIGWEKDLLVYVDAKPLTEAELEKFALSSSKKSEAQLTQHNEFYWRLRSWRALTFLFPPAQE